MELFKDSIIKVPQKLSETAFYKLLQAFDEAVISNYQITFQREDEYKAIIEAVRYFYKYPEFIWDGLDESTIREYLNDPSLIPEDKKDIKASEIDMEYLAMLILSGKSTREFTQYLINGSFSIEGSSDMIHAVTEDPYGLEVTPLIITASDANVATEELTQLLNHLLYFHSLNILIDTFIHIIEMEYHRYCFYQNRNINAIYYESI